ncbi:MAG: solute carrier family 23 protein [Pseudomonadota bacterium]
MQTPALLFGLDERPPWPQTGLAALAHLLAMVAGIATAPLLIARGLGLDTAHTAYVVGSALIVSGIATFLQVKRVGPLGSGLLSVQGTSFSFIGVYLYVGATLIEAGQSKTDVVGTLLGSSLACAVVTVVAGYYVRHLQRVITLNVTGIAIFLLGASLVGAAWNNLQFTLAATAVEARYLVWGQAGLVVAVVGLLALRRSPWLRLISIPAGLLAGMVFAWLTGSLYPAQAPETTLILLRPLPFELQVDWLVCLLLLPIFFVTMTEAIGDLTATSMLSRQPLDGPIYWLRIRGGVMADGVNSVLAALVGTFPNTTFSQNNGVIRLTAVASRWVGYLVAVLLILFGILPGVVFFFTSIPGGVLHSLTLLLFAMIAWTGFGLLRNQPAAARAMRMLIICSAFALALMFVPDLAAGQGITLPGYLVILFGFPVANGALLAFVWEAAVLFAGGGDDD